MTTSHPHLFIWSLSTYPWHSPIQWSNHPRRHDVSHLFSMCEQSYHPPTSNICPNNTTHCIITPLMPIDPNFPNSIFLRQQKVTKNNNTSTRPQINQREPSLHHTTIAYNILCRLHHLHAPTPAISSSFINWVLLSSITTFPPLFRSFHAFTLHGDVIKLPHR